jgi:serine/threonine protein kinase
MFLANRYRVVGELGAGGMGRLQLARTPQGQLVVIKTAHERADDERLRDEARVGMRLIHPHIVDTLDLIDVGGRPGLVTAYVSGACMLDLRKRGKLGGPAVCRIGRQIAEALDAIHHAHDERGRPLLMLHRDVTATNIIVGHDGRARLIDLGIARSVESRAERTESGSVRGTLRYLAPELFDNGPHSMQTDLWALGVVLFEALVGREAVKGSAAAAVGKICSGQVMHLEEHEEVEPRVLRAIGQLLKVKPEQRPARARDAAALFAMTEKEITPPGVDLDEELAHAVIDAVGPRPDEAGANNNFSGVMERAQALFGEPRSQTKNAPTPQPLSSTFDDREPLTLNEVVDEPEPEPLAPLPEPLPRTRTPSEQLLDYARRLQALEGRRM